MSFRSRTPWIAVTLTAVIVGGCGGSGGSGQAEIDKAVAAALATTTTSTTVAVESTTSAPVRKATKTTTQALGYDPANPYSWTEANHPPRNPDDPCLQWSYPGNGHPMCLRWNYETSTPASQPPGTAATTTTATTLRPAASKSWLKVSTFTGSGTKNGPVFELQGGQQRLSWTCSMPSSGYTGSSGFYVESTDSSLDSEGSFDCTTQAGRISDTGQTLLYITHAGPYYFKVLATPNNTWTVTIEEFR